MNEARYRTLERVFGCPKDQANLLTLVAAAVLLEGMRDRWQRIMSGPVTPSQGEVLLGMGSVRELMLSITGPALRDTPYLGALITAAFVGRAAAPTVIRSIRGIRTGSQRFNSGFRHRYGYLVDLGHRRQRHYEETVRERGAVR
jgi:hypothetical protein